MAGEFRADNASDYASTSALLVAMPSNQWWDGTAWVAASGLTESALNAGAILGSKEETSDSQWTGTWLFSLPETAPPAGTVTVRAFVTVGSTPNWSGGVLQVVDTSDYWMALPTSGGGGEEINITTETTVINS